MCNVDAEMVGGGAFGGGEGHRWPYPLDWNARRERGGGASRNVWRSLENGHVWRNHDLGVI